jgi:hypothetical protein
MDWRCRKMARQIDLDQLMKYPLRRGSEHCDGKNADPRFLNGVESILEWAQTLPTLTPPNEPLPVLVNDETGREYIDYICPRCKDIISQRRRGQRMETVYQCKYHDNCGQRVDWSNPQPYRRPPEGEENT